MLHSIHKQVFIHCHDNFSSYMSKCSNRYEYLISHVVLFHLFLLFDDIQGKRQWWWYIALHLEYYSKQFPVNKKKMKVIYYDVKMTGISHAIRNRIYEAKTKFLKVSKSIVLTETIVLTEKWYKDKSYSEYPMASHLFHKNQ